MTDSTYRILLQQAEAGDADAQNQLGCHYDDQGDYEQARQWFERAARHHHPAALWNLALMYELGQSVPVDLPKALRYNIAAGRAGEPDGWYQAALLLDEGEDGIAMNHARANHYYRLAAEAGHAEAACNFGSNCCHGIGIRKDFAKAFHYIHLAAERGDPLAFRLLGQHYYYGDGTQRNYHKAFDWFKRSWFASGDAPSARWLGDCYGNGHGVRKNLHKAQLWWKRAVKLGDDAALFELGWRYIAGCGIARDMASGRTCLERYLEIHPGDADALYWLGKSHSGYVEAMLYFEQLYRQTRDPWSAYEIVKLRLKCQSYFTPEEFTELTQMLRHAVRNNVTGAQRLLSSRRWNRIRNRVIPSEVLMTRYRESLRRHDGNLHILAELHRRGSRIEFELARACLNLPCQSDRLAGIDILAQLGMTHGHCPFAEETLPLLCAMLPAAQGPPEKSRILRAIAWQDTEAAGKILVNCVDAPETELRHIAAWGLSGKNRAELDALLRLANAPEEEVWDWAINNLIDENGPLYPELQAGLTTLARHPNPLLRCQAIAALAARHADNAEALLRRELRKAAVSEPELDYLKDAQNYLKRANAVSSHD